MTDIGHKRALGLVLGAIMVVAILVVAGAVSSRVVEPTGDGVSVAVTIFPIADIVRQVAGDKIVVELILDPGASPHTFELTPNKATKLANVERVFAIGQGLDTWAAKVASISGADVVELDQYVELSCDATCDPHYWLSIMNVIDLANGIASALTEIDPSNGEAYDQNATDYIVKLEIAHAEITSILNDAPSRDIVTFHDSWEYFAAEYDLEIRGTFEPQPGREPTPKLLAELSQVIDEFKIENIYKEPQLSDSTLKPFVQDRGLDIRVLDPLGGVENRASYIDLMLYNAHEIAAP